MTSRGQQGSVNMCYVGVGGPFGIEGRDGRKEKKKDRLAHKQ
jgi:hypothetical protein